MAYTDIDKPSDYFNTKLYTGTGATHNITGVGFQPDWVWIKERNSAVSHHLYDSVRGATKRLESDNTDAETTAGTFLTSFDSDGFTLGSNGGLNGSSDTYVAWNWKAGTSVSGNTGGSGTAKTYTGSVNTDAGFSIIRYIGNSTSGHTIPHHLGTTPALVIARTISVAKDWNVYHHKNTSAPETDVLVLNTTAATADDLGVWNDTAPTSSVVTLGDSSQLNTNDATCIMYAFAEKTGYSKFGSYVGNGNADGTFVYTGFKPAWVLVKRTDSAEGWYIFDNKRSDFNLSDDALRANLSNAEISNWGVGFDFLSNGFKARATDASINSSGGSYIYMCFAEAPLVGSNNVPCTAR